jgi:hypothetical protein
MMDECSNRRVRSDGQFAFCNKRGAACAEFLNEDCSIKFGTEIVIEEDIDLKEKFKQLTIKTFHKVDDILDSNIKSRDVLNLATGLKALYEICDLADEENMSDKEITKEEIKKIQNILGRSAKKNKN